VICDSLDAHVHPAFYEALLSTKMMRSLLKPNETEALQSIDVGIAAIFKWLIGDVQDRWLMQDPENLEVWEGDMSASLRRVLVTMWVGAAHERLCRDYQETITKCFEKCGQLMTMDGTNDNKIKPMKGIPYDFAAVGTRHERSTVESVLSGIVQEIENQLQSREDDSDGASDRNGDGDRDYRQLEHSEPSDHEKSLDDYDTSDDDADSESDSVHSTASHRDNVDENEELDSGDIDDVKLAVAKESPNNKLEEHVSFTQCCEYIREHYGDDATAAEESDDFVIPKRLTGFLLIYFDDDEGEWDVVKVERVSTDNTSAYRLLSITTGAWYYDVVLTADRYGRANRSFVMILQRGRAVRASA
jgi:hypothetical protein